MIHSNHPVSPRRRVFLLPTLMVLLTVLASSGSAKAQDGDRSTTRSDRAARRAAEGEMLARELAEARRRAIASEVEVERLRQRVLELEAELAARGPTTARDGLAGLDPYDPLSRGLAAGDPAAGGPAAGAPAAGAPAPEDAPAAGDPAASAPAAGMTGIEVEELDDPLEAEETVDAAGDSRPTVRATTNDQPPSTEALDLYDRGYALFHQEKYRQAEDLFADYIGRYPETELADNALFWVGECRWAREEYAGALDAFAETVTRFPSGNKVPDALLKAGKSLEALGRSDQAAATYQELVERFPGTLASINAEERLRGLGE